jgi:hypothetical protein
MTAEPTVELTGEVLVDLPPEAAYTYFTPEGERTWADHWDPQYPAGDTDDTAVGTVFITGTTTWIVLDAEPGRFVRYARTTPGDRAGLVSVSLAGTPEQTRATVTYTLTALTEAARAGLDEFAAHYPAFLDSWQHAIADSLDR